MLKSVAAAHGIIPGNPVQPCQKSTMSFVITPPAQPAVPVAGGGLFAVHRIYCVGRNYAEHAQEMGFSGREPPFFFLKPADAVLPVADGATGEMAYPPLTTNLHHEIELVVAIGTGGRNIAAADAAKHIWGYAVGLDMTRRDLQNDMKKQGRPWCIGKGFDESAPIAPLQPIARTGELTRGAITLSVNGTVRQKGDLSELIWNVAETIETLSKAWTLQSGDLIYTGTPAGVGAVVSGDVMQGFIEGLGTLKVCVR
jgi:fumarylpyruvate hydrolase